MVNFLLFEGNWKLRLGSYTATSDYAPNQAAGFKKHGLKGKLASVSRQDASANTNEEFNHL